MIVLFTDFGSAGPYVGQMRAVLHSRAPGIAVIDLFNDAPSYDPMLSAYLLPAYVVDFPMGSVFLCVIDPGVGTARRPVVLQADGHWFVGPDNGLFAQLVRRAASTEAWQIIWRPKRLSASFHGRDLFAPVAAQVAIGADTGGAPIDAASLDRPTWPDDLPRIIYIDAFGNAMTGVRASAIGDHAVLEFGGRQIERRHTFGDAEPGQLFWYENANGLAEIAVNRGRADREIGLTVGMDVAWRET